MPLPDRGWSMSVKLETVSRIIGGVADGHNDTRVICYSSSGRYAQA
jgi:hypothetical protein